MTLFQEAAGDPRATAAVLTDVLAFYGALGDLVSANPPGFARRKAAIAVALANATGCDTDDCNAISIAATLHAVGAIGNAAFRKDQPHLSERRLRMASWDIPAQGAAICRSIDALPPRTADLVRWQCEAWDGTGFPDQRRGDAIPQAAQFLALADTFARTPEPEEALASIGLQSGRAFAPEATRIFTMWFHTTGGAVTPVPFPTDALQAPSTDEIVALIERVADAVDDHNETPGRWRRIAPLCEATADQLDLSSDERRALALAVRLFGTGEVSGRTEPSRLDPLVRLGIDLRASHARNAADLAESHPALRSAGPIMRSRAEWFDGTGKPKGLRHGEIPRASEILATAIAYDELKVQQRLRAMRSPNDRLDIVAGTQFDPHVVRALLLSAETSR